MPVYNKLVRDLIPRIIASKGRTCRTRMLDEEAYRKELLAKLKEEADEYFAAERPEEALEELADMLEVMRALAAVHGATWEQLEAIGAKKTALRGGFRDHRVYLIDVDGDE
ncbi:nucleoside triphosphate pyrophosphohydrolase [Paenibacillus lycopersici]|uniref:Nucleoside triphosphate pyrophosphohydrolase n=1 Tax=Paenibacillus lycopersici TaxID=2704462 RepID=A0A6C0FVS4_9BACL|nr:nucleoside triphosphate pyrophosphohydrolase [Paenibacillus lycopersici]QHT59394.1 nucleoside triphosphate pyrophosphohydrolase [Paenibacillus lycopersici]